MDLAYRFCNGKSYFQKNGWLFYKDNNIYFLHKSGDEEYTLINVYSEYEMSENEIIAFPSLAGINFTSMSFELAEQGDYDLLSLVFDNYDYSKAKEIYALFDDSNVSFKEAEQQIWIKGYHGGEKDESVSVSIEDTEFFANGEKYDIVFVENVDGERKI